MFDSSGKYKLCVWIVPTYISISYKNTTKCYNCCFQDINQFCGWYIVLSACQNDFPYLSLERLARHTKLVWLLLPALWSSRIFHERLLYTTQALFFQLRINLPRWLWHTPLLCHWLVVVQTYVIHRWLHLEVGILAKNKRKNEYARLWMYEVMVLFEILFTNCIRQHKEDK